MNTLIEIFEKLFSTENIIVAVIVKYIATAVAVVLHIF